MRADAGPVRRGLHHGRRTCRPAVLAAGVALATALALPQSSQAAVGRGDCASTATRAAAAPEVSGVTPDTGFTQEWTDFGNGAQQGQWAAGDGTYSAELPDGRTAWLFNDTFTGPVRPDGGIESKEMIHNTIVTTEPGSRTPAHSFLRGEPDAPEPVVGPNGTDEPWYWNTDGIVDDGKLYVFEARQQKSDGGDGFGFEWVGTDLARLSLPDFDLEELTPTYDAAGITWGVQLLPVDDYIYIYGQGRPEESGAGKQAFVARAHKGELDGSWEFYDGAAWSGDEQDAAPIASDVGASFGVAEVQGHYVMVTTDSSLGSQIHLLDAPTPWDFAAAEREEVYDTPEGQPDYDEDMAGNVYTYNVAVHPSLTGPDSLEISYNVNDTDFDELTGDISLNRARFVRIDFPPRPEVCVSP